MCKLVLDRGGISNFTSVSNIFIDEYMNKANGEFVKIYLHLLRLVGSMSESSEEFSTEKIAEHFNILESDVYRALKYWHDEKVIILSFDNEGKIIGVALNNYIQTKAVAGRIIHQDANVDVTMLAKASGESVSVPASSSKEFIVPAKKKRSPKEISKLGENGKIKELCFLAETYLGITLSPAIVDIIIYIVEDLQLECELVEMLLEQKDTSLKQVEKQAVAYAKHGILTLEDAKRDMLFREKITKSIYKVFGIETSAPVKREIDFISKWHSEFGFDDDLIIEACNRTMANTHKGSFEYTDSILTNWYNKGAMSIKDVEKLDKEHSKKQDEKYSGMKSPQKSKKKKNILRHEYDVKELEEQLLKKRKN